MTIASAIAAKQQQVADAYTACDNKGATMPGTQNLTNLATCIGTISGGGSSPVITSLSITPTTSAQTITAPSGTDGYSPITVSAVTSSIDSNISAENIKKDVTILGVVGSYEGSGGGSSGDSNKIKANYILTSSDGTTYDISKIINSQNQSNILDPKATSITTNDFLRGAYSGSTIPIREACLSALTTISGDYGLYGAFSYITTFTKIDLSALTTVSGVAGLRSLCEESSSLTSVDLSALTTISGRAALVDAFRKCNLLEKVDFLSLTTITGEYAFETAFYQCKNLKSLSFPALTTSSFGSSKNQFTQMMLSTGNTTTHTIHFPSNLQSVISELEDYPRFSGYTGYVILAFDLPATS